jgi:AcrR family transcriptional regulator
VAGSAARTSTTRRAARERKGDRTRRRVLEHAIRRFAADGFRRTSVSDIARDAGITPATTYGYFAGKAALFDAAVDADADAMIHQARGEMSGPTVRDRWLPWLTNLISALDEHPLAGRVLAGKEPKQVARLVDLPALRSVREELAADLVRGQATGEIRADVDAAALAQGIETIVLSTLIAWVQVAPHDDTRAVGYLTVLDAALRAPAANQPAASKTQS